MEGGQRISKWSGMAMVLLLVLTVVTLGAAPAAAQDGEEDSGKVMVLWVIVLLTSVLLVATMYAAMVTIHPHEQGLKVIMGKYAGRMDPGLNMVPPFITKVVHVDLRDRVFDVPGQEMLFRDMARARADAIIHLKVVDPGMSAFQVTDYKRSTVALAQTTLRTSMGELAMEEFLENGQLINKEMRDRMNEETHPWGVRINSIEIRDVVET